jgi:hypothetical protein
MTDARMRRDACEIFHKVLASLFRITQAGPPLEIECARSEHLSFEKLNPSQLQLRLIDATDFSTRRESRSA